MGVMKDNTRHLQALCCLLLITFFIFLTLLYSLNGDISLRDPSYDTKIPDNLRRQISFPSIDVTAAASLLGISLPAGRAQASPVDSLLPSTALSGSPALALPGATAAASGGLPPAATAAKDPFAALSSGLAGIFSGTTGSSTPSLNASTLAGLFGSSANFNISDPFAALRNGLDGIGKSLLGLFNGTGFTLGVGLGTGASSGLNLTTPEQAKTEATAVLASSGVQVTGINSFALDVGNGLAAGVVPLVLKSNMNISALASFVFPLAQGIGNGTIVGLKISAEALKPPSGTDTNDLVGGLGFGISESLASNIDMSKLGVFVGLNMSAFPASFNMKAVLESAGQGLSQGALTGLGVANGKFVTLNDAQLETNGSMLNVPAAVSDFTRGLSSSLLANVDLEKVQAKFRGATNNLDIPKIVEGLARGLVDGAMIGINAAGGISNLINGKIPQDALTKARVADNTSDSTFAFNDSLNGSAIAFGRGLSNEAVLQIGSVIKSKVNSVVNGTMPRRKVILDERQSIPIDKSTSPIINSTFLNFLSQQSINTLQCDGVGGFGSIIVGLVNSKTLSFKQLSGFKLSNSTSELLPSDPITIKLDGNSFTFGLKDIAAAKINGIGIIPFGIFTVLHIFISISAFFVVLPLFIILACIQRIAELSNLQLSNKCKAWQRRVLCYIFSPLALFGTIFGVIGMGNSGHFRTAHGILGFITIIFAIAMLLQRFYYCRSLRIQQSIEQPLNYKVMYKPWKYSIREWKIVSYALVIALANSAFPLGFTDLRSFSLCIVSAVITLPVAIGLGGGLMMVMATAMTLVQLVVWMEGRREKERNTLKKVQVSFPQPDGDASMQVNEKEYYVAYKPPMADNKTGSSSFSLPRKPVLEKDISSQVLPVYMTNRVEGDGQDQIETYYKSRSRNFI